MQRASAVAVGGLGVALGGRAERFVSGDSDKGVELGVVEGDAVQQRLDQRGGGEGAGLEAAAGFDERKRGQVSVGGARLREEARAERKTAGGERRALQELPPVGLAVRLGRHAVCCISLGVRRC